MTNPIVAQIDTSSMTSQSLWSTDDTSHEGFAEPMKVIVDSAEAEDTTQTASSLCDGEEQTSIDTLKKQHAELLAENERLRADKLAAERAQSELLQTAWWPWSQMAEHAQHNMEIQPGAIVSFHGLKQDVGINGMCGMVDRWHEESERWVVQLPNGHEKITKPENLFVMQPCMDFNSTYFQANRMTSQPNHGGQRFPRGPRDRNKDSSVGSWSTSCSLNSSFKSSTSDANIAVDPTLTNTTVMMRNIPNHMSRDMLLELLDGNGFKRAYDLVYLPVDFRTVSNLGYAFVNLVSEEEVNRFHSRFTGFTDWGILSEKACVVDMSQSHPGREAQIERHRNSPLNHESVPDWCKPILLKDGVRVPFPPPTRPICPPRYWRSA
jgi:RNA recognition motif-containing protein|eukprot:TRINITY_DN67232_c0_g1_i1.p1 TRINITY_DN67232_c0_g1~~TRINITY_DN67232_c0_g1_i1.p1  ORF type:complete len:379 (+),score=51.25 TRINITY_DN67232_c0_g1_i1:82-1218(+)